MYRIIIGGISTECSSYSPLFQNNIDFKRIEGDKLIKHIDFDFKKYNIEVNPIFFDYSLPGGPIKKSIFDKKKEEFLLRLKLQKKIDGVLLIMHGAMYVPNVEDPEGEWIQDIRKIVGKKCLISLSYDLHGQVTDLIIKNINYFAAFKTAPHIDVNKTYKRAAKMLSDGLITKKNNFLSWLPIPILVSGEMSSTFVDPCKSIYSKLDKLNKIKNILDTNLLIGYVWADVFRATAAAVVNSSDELVGKKVCREIANLYWNKRHELKFDMNTGSISVILKNLPNDFLIIADSGDNPTAGAVGDRADILQQIINYDLKNVLFAGIASPKIFKKLEQNKNDNFIIGGELGGGGPFVNITPKSVNIINDCAIVNFKSITLIITKYRRPFHYFKDFEDLNIDLTKYKILVVKSGYLSPDLKKIRSKSYMVLSDGAVNQNITALTNNFRKKNIFPFFENANFKFDK